MRIREIITTVVSVPARYPIRSAVRVADRVINVLVEVRTDEGPSGRRLCGRVHGRQGRGGRGDDRRPGRDVGAGPTRPRVGAAWDRMWAATTPQWAHRDRPLRLSPRSTSPSGIYRGSCSARRSIACSGRAARPCAPTPATAAGCTMSRWRSRARPRASPPRGSTPVKIRFGRPSPEDDIATLEAVWRARSARASP